MSNVISVFLQTKYTVSTIHATDCIHYTHYTPKSLALELNKKVLEKNKEYKNKKELQCSKN